MGGRPPKGGIIRWCLAGAGAEGGAVLAVSVISDGVCDDEQDRLPLDDTARVPTDLAIGSELLISGVAFLDLVGDAVEGILKLTDEDELCVSAVVGGDVSVRIEVCLVGVLAHTESLSHTKVKGIIHWLSLSE